MLKSRVCLNWNMKFSSAWTPEDRIRQDRKVMPISRIYGNYGGDTIFMFSFLLFAERAGVCGKILYNYRVSPTGNTYVFRPGRLDSDKTVFYFTRNVLNYFGPVSEEAERFLYHVYGNALRDTTVSLFQQPIDEQALAEQLMYIYNCELTVDLFDRQRRGALTLKDSDQIDFIELLYQRIFRSLLHRPMAQSTAELYLKLLSVFYPRLDGILAADELILLLQEDHLLDMLRTGNYYELFAGLLALLKCAGPQPAQTCLRLLRRVTYCDVLKPFLQEQQFVLTYSALLRKANQGNWDETLQALQKSFSKKHEPGQAVRLADLWIVLAADAEDVGAFIVGKELKTELLLENGERDAALSEFGDLIQLGAADENMDVLSDLLSGSFGAGD